MRIERIKEVIEQNTERIPEAGCWIWLRSLRANKYGHFQLCGRGLVAAHRAAYEAYIGPIPEGKVVLHRCDVTYCCNPSHLYIGTQADNIGDMWRKERAGINRLSQDDVAKIKAAYVSGRTRRELREQFGVSKAQLGKIVTGKAWAWA